MGHGPAIRRNSPHYPARRPCRPPPRSTAFPAKPARRKPYRPWSLPATSPRMSLGGLGRHLTRLLDCLIDRTDHVEGGFRQAVILARDDPFEAFNRIGEVDEDALGSGEDLGDM